MTILVINPGSTSTKLAVFSQELKEIFSLNIKHSNDELEKFSSIGDQFNYRKKSILDKLNKEGIDLNNLREVVGRGGLLKPIPSGVYRIDKQMIKDLKLAKRGEHASNLGAIIAYEIAEKLKIPSYILDPVIVDELSEIARLSGHPEFERISIFHALSHKAVGQKFAREVSKDYKKLNLIIVHLGGGITVGAHEKGQVIDVNNGLDGEGAFSPERSGTLPSGALVKLCFSGTHSEDEIKKLLKGSGGMIGYLGTNDAQLVEEMIIAGDQKAELVFSAMAYQVSKMVGEQATVLKGKVDQIIITGGLAKSEKFIALLKERISFISPVTLYNGENEMLALAQGISDINKGFRKIQSYS